MSTRPPLRHRLTAALTLLVYVSLLLLVPSCGDQGSKTITGAREAVPSYSCEDTLTGQVTPAAPIEGVSNIRYRLGRDGTIRLELLDAAAAVIGTVQITIEMILGSQFGANIDASYEEGGEVKASQSTQVRLAGGRWLGRTRQAVGQNHALLWSALDLDGKLAELSLGAPLAAGAVPAGTAAVVDQGTAYVAHAVITEGGQADVQGARAFIQQQSLAAINGATAFQRLTQAAEDLAWLDDAEIKLRRCTASSAADLEPGLSSTSALSVCSQAKSTAGAGSSSQARNSSESSAQTQQAIEGCSTSDSPFAKVLQIESILGSVAAGLVIAGVLAVAWPAIFAGSTTALVVTLVGSSVAAYVVGNWISSLVNAAAGAIPGLNQLRGIGSSGTGSVANAVSNASSGSRGDPHLFTTDGLFYDLQAAGEFVLLESTGQNPWQVQVRQEPGNGICPNIAFNTAVATKLGDATVHLDIAPERQLMVGGILATVPGDALLFDNGDSLERTDKLEWTLTWATGERLSVSGVGNARSLDLSLHLPSNRKHAVRGLLGNFDGDRNNDISLRDGTLLAQPIKHAQLISEFAASYRIAHKESLFSYATGGTTADYDVPGFPTGEATPADLPEAVRTSAEQTCKSAGIENPISLDACILDVGCTGDADLTESHVGVLPDSKLNFPQPVDYSGWVAEGQGTWVPDTDGLSVVQLTNGDPTFYVSPDDYLGVQFTGSLTVETTGDDDIIGFVLGYQTPLTASGDDPDDLNAVIISWKAVAQNYVGGVAQEGLTLSRSSGLQTDLRGTLWHHPESPIYKVLATSYGSDKGWMVKTTYKFVLTYTASLVEVSIDGAPLFSVTSAQAGAPFEAGRFGFYNFSQSNVRYADFSVTQLN